MYAALDLNWHLDKQMTLRTALPNSWQSATASMSFLKQLRPQLAFVKSAWFELVIQFVILVNVIISILFTEYSSLQKNNKASTVITTVFLVIYGFEATVKLIGLGSTRYFASSWNCFDFVIVVATLGSLLYVWPMQDYNFSSAELFRCLRLLRLFRIRQSMRQVLQTMTFLLRNLAKYILALVLIMYRYVHALDVASYTKSYPVTNAALPSSACLPLRSKINCLGLRPFAP